MTNAIPGLSYESPTGTIVVTLPGNESEELALANSRQPNQPGQEDQPSIRFSDKLVALQLAVEALSSQLKAPVAGVEKLTEKLEIMADRTFALDKTLAVALTAQERGAREVIVRFEGQDSRLVEIATKEIDLIKGIAELQRWRSWMTGAFWAAGAILVAEQGIAAYFLALFADRVFKGHS